MCVRMHLNIVHLRGNLSYKHVLLSKSDKNGEFLLLLNKQFDYFWRIVFFTKQDWNLPKHFKKDIFIQSISYTQNNFNYNFNLKNALLIKRKNNLVEKFLKVQ